jgi:hypothetical protein
LRIGFNLNTTKKMGNVARTRGGVN